MRYRQGKRRSLISDKPVLETFADSVISEYSNIDCLINNDLPLMKDINECSCEEFQYAMSVRVTALFCLSKLFMPLCLLYHEFGYADVFSFI